MRPAWCAAVFLALSLWLAAPIAAQDHPPLHDRIDQLIEAAAIGPLVAQCSDADFVRRLYLDLTGVIPTAEEARVFFADSTAEKRQRLIDKLIASPAFLRHMTITLDVMLMERKPEKAVKQPEWETFLYQSLAEDKPLDQLFRELIAADGANEPLRPAARFVLDRDAEANLVTRDVGRLVFGMDLQCCQCHDHPLIDDYYQEDYYGLFAFVHRTSLFTDPKTKQALLMEKADGEASFKSVFTGAGRDRALARLPKGTMLVSEPVFKKGDEYLVKPDKTVRGVPKFSRRGALAEMLPSSLAFRRNLANRLWALMLGRGIVHPLDFHHAANPPANPALLALLTDELQNAGFKLRPLIREIALTRAYQRSCEAPRPEIVNFADIAARLDRLNEQKERQISSLPPLKEALAKAKSDLKKALDERVRLAKEISDLEKGVADARQALLKISAKAGELAKADDEAAVSAWLREHDAARAKLADAEAALANTTRQRPPAEKLAALEQVQLAAERSLVDANYEIAATKSQIALAQSILDYPALAKTAPAKAASAWSALVERWTIGCQIAPLKPLTPEQFAASAMQATGMLASITANLKKAQTTEPKKGSEQVEQLVSPQMVQLTWLNQLRPTFTEFVKHYGGLPGEDFQATVNQALFFGNGSVIDGWLKRGNIVGLALIDETDKLADEMSCSVFSRPASETEKASVAAYLKDRAGDRDVAITEMYWAMLSSSEFRFNH